MKIPTRNQILILFASTFVAIPVADYVSAVFVSLTFNIYGLAGLMGHSIVGMAYGLVFYKFFAESANKLIVLLPITLLVGAATLALFRFLSQDRVFMITDWLGYILTSHFGFNWLLVLPGSAYLLLHKMRTRTRPPVSDSHQ